MMLHPFGNDLREQQALRFVGDGLFELVLGAALVFVAVFIGGGGMAAIVPVLAFALLPALKHTITVPRLRSSDLLPDIEQRLRRALSVAWMFAGGLLLSGLLLSIFINAGALAPIGTPWAVVLGGIALILLAVLGVFGWATRAWRFGAYIALALIATAVGHLFQAGLAQILAALGAAIALGGLVELIRFLRSHPRQQR